MRKLMSLATVLSLMLSVTGCAGSSKSEPCCPMCASGCKAEGKPMKCGNCTKCAKMEKPAWCCSKSAADGKAAEAHHH